MSIWIDTKPNKKAELNALLQRFFKAAMHYLKWRMAQTMSFVAMLMGHSSRISLPPRYNLSQDWNGFAIPHDKKIANRICYPLFLSPIRFMNKRPALWLVTSLRKLAVVSMAMLLSACSTVRFQPTETISHIRTNEGYRLQTALNHA